MDEGYCIDNYPNRWELKALDIDIRTEKIKVVVSDVDYGELDEFWETEMENNLEDLVYIQEALISTLGLDVE